MNIHMQLLQAESGKLMAVQKADIKMVATNMFRHMEAHRAEFQPYGFGYIEAEKIHAILAEKHP